MCSGWDRGIKLRALVRCILLCDSEKTLRLFMVEEMMLSRINMAKSSYQLHNGQATWLRSKQHHPQWGGCVYAYILYVCGRCYLQFIYNLCGCMCVHCCMCVFWKCVYPRSFNQRPIVRRCGGSCLSLFPQIKLCVSMPVTYLIWDAPLSSPHLAAAHTDSTLLHTSMTLAPPEEGGEGEK